MAWAYPDRIAQRRLGGNGRFLLSSGRGARLDPAEPLSACDYLATAHLDGDRREARIFMAAAIDKADLMDQFADRLQWRTTVAWDAERQAVISRRQQCLEALVLSSDVLDAPDADAVTAALIDAIRGLGIDSLPWTRSLRTLQARVELLRQLEGDDAWPDLSDPALADGLSDWLAPHLSGIARLKAITPALLENALRGRLGWQRQRRLEQQAPTHITVPSGSRRPIDYRGSVPVLAVRIQEMFGCTTTPAIADGRIPLLLHLLTPAGRPAQITRDLAGFWQTSYAAVRRELKGRYPKHAWPEDPATAPPMARVRPRGGH